MELMNLEERFLPPLSFDFLDLDLHKAHTIWCCSEPVIRIYTRPALHKTAMRMSGLMFTYRLNLKIDVYRIKLDNGCLKGQWFKMHWWPFCRYQSLWESKTLNIQHVNLSIKVLIMKETNESEKKNKHKDEEAWMRDHPGEEFKPFDPKRELPYKPKK